MNHISAANVVLFSALLAPVNALAQGGDRRDFSKLVWEIALHGGVNAARVTLLGEEAKYVSNGYNGFALGGGVVLLPSPIFAFEVDGIYSGRVFGFGDTKGYFNCFQIPAMAHIRLGPLRLGGGAYGAFWSQKGKMLTGDASSEISTEDFGNDSREFGFVTQIGFTAPIAKIPIRFEFRSFSSSSDVAKSPTLKGALTEYQFLVGYDFDKSDRLPFWKYAGGT